MLKKEWAEKWREENRHPCIDCGKPCNFDSERCRSCGSRHWQSLRKKFFYCFDCGKIVYQGSKRCRSCFLKLLAKEGRPKGKDSSTWKGGRHKAKGYIYIYAREHPHCNSNNRIAEHILIWEQAHNQYLPDGWVVHHINGIRDDNRLENLYAMPKKNHHSYLLLNEVKKRLRVVENELKRIKSQTNFNF